MMCVYMYIYIYVCVCVCVCVWIHMYELGSIKTSISIDFLIASHIFRVIFPIIFPC